jgi:hypothetical protein
MGIQSGQEVERHVWLFRSGGKHEFLPFSDRIGAALF